MSSQNSLLSSQCVTLGSSIHYSPFGLCFHGKCKNYLQVKPPVSAARMTKKGKVFSNPRVKKSK